MYVTVCVMQLAIVAMYVCIMHLVLPLFFLILIVSLYIDDVSPSLLQREPTALVLLQSGTHCHLTVIRLIVMHAKDQTVRHHFQ